MKQSQVQQIKKAYNKMADKYLLERSHLRSNKYVSKFEASLSPQSFILDVGCGAGVPVDDFLIKKGHLLTGIDISEIQINLAKKYCKRGAFFVKDILNFKENEYQADAVIFLYTLFHIPKEKHLKILKILASFLPSKGKLLISMGDKDFEGEHYLYGEKVWSSHYGPEKNKKLIEDAGFKIILNEIDKSAEEKHQFILAEKR